MLSTGAQYSLKTQDENKCSDEWKKYFLGQSIMCVGEQKGNEKNRAEMHKVCTIMKNNVSGVMKNNVDTFMYFFH